ncbi:PREDICTED: regulator of chromosome condensation-like [Papilio polytes]|uniref:regulator of chromosome condensation-like n=1 Tax=Papilio polytes TaxID=76194 RepID=UPI000675C89D|nr:PREDICTED: regulator of chromosome condensation-like [Papilio polytes]XP_013145734.1 PREDICTED: regulator of chromosome condensation-like [Papilio polytes]XP_013145735.1 PREDICTED: regulator of chromosome condensation-like [Papilio polytes]
MPAARGVKRTASKSSAPATTTGPKNKKKRGAVQLEIPSAPKKRGRVYTCGQGDVGQLGLGEDVVETTKFKYVSALGDKIVDIRAGGMHTVAIDTDGKVWTFGCNDEGALGRITKSDKEEGTPKTVELPEKAVAISAGDSHTAALLDNGDVYAWGAFRDSHGSMGLVVRGRETRGCPEPVRVDVAESAVALASGGDHLVILSSSGAVYSMGCGEQGQLGRLSQRSASRDARQGFSALLTPAKVTLKMGASRVWAGCHATFVLDANGDKVFAFGLNNYGQLGITGEKRKTAIFSPMECDAFTSASSTWSAVACGQHHSLATDGNGRLYSIGRTDYGRLGLGERAEDAEVPEVVPKLQSKRCVSIAAGIANSFAVTDTGEVFSWGMGSEGQLGTGAAADASEPTAPVAPHASAPLAVSAGGQHTVLLLEETKELSPPPENKAEIETQEETTEEQETEEKKRPAKRQKKQEQDEEISSTSTAQSAEAKPEKVNGGEQKENAMEVDETDKPDDKPEDKKQEQEENETEQAKDIPDTMDTSSQETTDSESKMDTNSQSVQNMDTNRQDCIQADNALTTSA